MRITICSFYKFFNIKNKNLIKLGNKIKKFCFKEEIYGTIIISTEGINASISVKNESIATLKCFFEKIFLEKFIFKFSKHIEHPFLKLKVKIKKEVVKLGIKNLEFNQSLSYLSPNEWNKFVNKENIILIDVRNNYESEIGSFENSTIPNTTNFSEFPKWVKKNKDKFNGKKIGIFCTGGIRCEKAGTFLINFGFKHIHQLEGGIINYLDKISENNSIWKGECFVFDERVSVNHLLQKGSYIQCFACRHPLSKNDIKSKDYQKGISCPNCVNLQTKKQQRRFSERERQIKISKTKGISYFGSKKS